jgi:hypothetical protein
MFIPYRGRTKRIGIRNEDEQQSCRFLEGNLEAGTLTLSGSEVSGMPRADWQSD